MKNNTIFRAACLALMTLAMAPSCMHGAQQPSPEHEIVDMVESYWDWAGTGKAPQIIGEPPYLPSVWISPGTHEFNPVIPPIMGTSYGPAIWYHITINEKGKVLSVRPEDSSTRHDDHIRKSLEESHFTPFIDDHGQPRPARFRFIIYKDPFDYTGPDDRAFPEVDDLAEVYIHIRTASCLGKCPTLNIGIRGNGEIFADGIYYSGDSWRDFEIKSEIPQEKVEELVELFRKSDFFKLEREYRWMATDHQSATVTLIIGDQAKYVVDYVGEEVGMPAIVNQIEAKIFEVSGVTDLLEGAYSAPLAPSD